MQEVTFLSDDHVVTAFGQAEQNAWLSRLLGLACGLNGLDDGPRRARGLLVLDTSLGRFEADRLTLVERAFDAREVRFVWEAAEGRLRVVSQWSFAPDTGVWSRRDTLHNLGREDVTIYRCQARFVFAPGRYELYSQDSRWSNENQGNWRSLDCGSVVLANEGGRTCQGGTPYMALREAGADRGVAFHIMPRGNWTLRVSAHTSGGDGAPYAVVELGLADGELRLRLPAGESFDLPEILAQAVPGGEPHRAAPALHRYLLEHHYATAKPVAPVVYNTWFDVFEVLDVPRLRRQLAAAREVGCEVFTIDAGWYGASEGHWWEQTGDWREKLDASFHGRMNDFAEEVRAAGLGFGIWVEPERIGPHAPIRKEHPEWFLPTEGPNAYPNMEDPAVQAYMLAEFTRLIETYQLAWIKVDFNHELGPDRSGAELSRYYEGWFGVLDALRARYPQVYFEGCASGGMRSDSNTVTHFDGHFLSDTVNPFDVLRIYQGALLRAVPGRWCKWAVLRSAGQVAPRYLSRLEDSPEVILAPQRAVWDRSISVELDFAARVALCGMFGLSGDLAGLPAVAREQLAGHVAFFKVWRDYIAGSVAHLLTPPRPIADRMGWAAIQFTHPTRSESLVFAYRLDDVNQRKCFPLCSLKPLAQYAVSVTGGAANQEAQISGADLMSSGLDVDIASHFNAAVIVIREL
jgi:alpha-galactosidase